MNSDKAAAVRDSINGCPTVIDEEAIVERDGDPSKIAKSNKPTYTGDRMEIDNHWYRPAYIEQSGTVGNGQGSSRPVYVVVLETLWTEPNDVRTLPAEMIYEVAKHDCYTRFYPPGHRLEGDIWIVDHFSEDLSESDGDRCPQCDGTYFKMREGDPECARCGHQESQSEHRQRKLMTDGGELEDGTYRIENARVVGHEWKVKLAFVTEYEFSLVAGHECEHAIEDAEELALYGDQEKSDRFLLHSEAEPTRDVYEDDVEAEEIRWIDGPIAPSVATYWDDSRHFDDRYVDTETEDDHDV